MTTFRIMAAAGILTGAAALAQSSGVHRTDLRRRDLSVPGWEAVQVRVDIDPGVTAPKHRHPGEEIVYVLDGSLEYQLDGRPPGLILGRTLSPCGSGAADRCP